MVPRRLDLYWGSQNDIIYENVDQVQIFLRHSDSASVATLARSVSKDTVWHKIALLVVCKSKGSLENTLLALCITLLGSHA